MVRVRAKVEGCVCVCGRGEAGEVGGDRDLERETDTERLGISFTTESSVFVHN